MKIKVFIVTYNNYEYLKNNIISILNSDLINYDYSINVIDNYCLDQRIKELCVQNNINLFENTLRPYWSTGHLSRSWNQCIINGFKNLNNPDCDILVLCQDDNLFLPNWCSDLIAHHKKYEFISMGGGDQFHSYKPEHIKKVGLWDERFCNIGYQEYDYFIRSYIYNKEYSSVNDRLFVKYNEIGLRFINHDDHLIGVGRGDKRHLDSLQYHSISQNILIRKWGEGAINWNTDYLSILKVSKIPNYVYYPYFEKDIYNLKEKNYLF